MNQGVQSRKGCLRPLLIGIITVVSLSFAIFYSIFLRGRYNGKDLKIKAIVVKEVDVWQGPGQILEDVTVVMEGQLITCVGKDCEIPAGAKVLEGKDKSLIPGLVDMQLGFYALSSENQDKSPLSTLVDYTRQRPDVRRHLHEAGITTFRSPGDPMNNIRLLKKQVQDWEMAGPRVYGVGPVFTATGGHPAGTIFKEDPKLAEAYSTQVSDSNLARNAVLEALVEYGMDGIKIMLDDLGGEVPKLGDGLAKAIVEQAKRKRAWVSARTGSNQDLQKAVNWGVDIIEYVPREPIDTTSLSLLTKNNVLVVPVIIASKIIPSGLNAGWFSNKFVEENVKKMADAGVSIATGTATGKDVSFGSSLHQEMEFLVGAGLSPEQVLEAACQHPLRVLRLDDQLGKIEKDYTAEAVLINGRPWENIQDIRKVEAVIQDGRLVVENGTVVD